MTTVPALPQTHTTVGPGPAAPAPHGARGHEDLRLGEIWAGLVRNRWVLLGCAALAVAAAVGYSFYATPTYEASATIRIQERQLDLSEVYHTLSSGVEASDLATEMEVLSSRALREAAATTLGLQVQLLEPERVSRQQLLRQIAVDSTAVLETYKLVRTADRRFQVTLADSGRQVGWVGPDGIFRLPGVSFQLTPSALNYSELEVGIQSLESAVEGLADAVTIDQPRHDAYIVTVGYATTDSLLARDVPNAITNQYLARRQSNQTEDARNTVAFLKEQLARVSVELSDAEESFRSFKESRQVLDPAVEGSSQVARLVNQEAERSGVEAERAALAKSLAEIETSPSKDSLGPARYQQLVGLPFFVNNPAAASVLSALMTAQADRAALVGRTAKDPDVVVLSAKIADLQGQLHGMTTTYLDGLTNKVGSLNQQLTLFQRQLDSIPGKQLQYGRLDRHVTALEQVYTLLQGRLQEAEIAQAAKDISVQVVDTAVAPSSPSSPNLILNCAVALALGLLLGLLVALVREFRDTSVHSRHDIALATGVPVLGLIPRMPHSKGRVAMLAKRLRPAALPRSNKAAKYAFFDTVPASEVRTWDASRAVVGQLAVPDWGMGVAEAYGLLQTHLAFAHSGPPIKVVVVTSPLAEDGKTTCATNLAITLALRGSSTLLVDADLRRGVVHVPFEVDREPGLSEVLADPELAASVIRKVSVGPEGHDLHFMTTGALPANPSGLLETGFATVLAALRERFEFIVIDCPPVNIISDACVLGLQADGVLVVARSGVTQSGALAYATEQLSRVGVPLLGVVLNDIDFKRDMGYDSSYQHYATGAYTRGSSR